MRSCKRCGTELPLDASFCPNCGTSATEPETRPIETRRTLKIMGKPRVIVSNTAPGTIEVRTGSEAEVTVDLNLRRSEDLNCNISQEGSMVTVTCRPRIQPFWGGIPTFFQAVHELTSWFPCLQKQILTLKPD